jgi:beta-galactosidase
MCKQFGALAAIAILWLCSCDHAVEPQAAPTTPRQQRLIDADWRFHLGDISPNNEVISANYDDAKWRQLDLPHDYVLEGPYVRRDDKPGRTHGDLPAEVGWYRKHLTIPASDDGKILRLDFDGVFRDSQVWLNGQLLGRHPGGYAPFSYDITKLAKRGAENVIVVRVDPREFEGHWYEGGGIYRHVWLTALAPLHVAKWGTYVISKVENDQANLTIQTTLENGNPAAAKCEVVSEITGPDGQSVAIAKATESTDANGQRDVVQQTALQHPKLWSLESPNLYRLRTTILQDGHPVDFTITTFGIRTIHFDPDKGFFLNGRHVEIQGVAMHQDLPAVGIAVPDSLQAWRVEQLKKLGCNGWRTAHNPPNEAMLDACDRLGMLVMDENRHLGDAYGHHSLPGTTANDLSDLSAMILRDRNHPSVIMWSMCNEEGLRNKPEGQKLFAEMTKRVHRFDTTRPITSAINSSSIAKGITDEDIIGVNYHFKEYDAFHEGNPHTPMFGSETTNEKTTRGEYADNPEAGMRGAYDLSEKGWQAIADRPFMAGAYVWTGFDYKGEPNPYQWPDVANHTGLLDSCGFPKDKAYYFQSCWSDKPMVHIMPATWNSPGKQGQNIRVIAFSNAQRVELFLNGKSLGAQDVPRNGHVEWQVPYAPGELLAIASNAGKIVAADKVETTGDPTHLDLTPDRISLKAGDEDAVVVAVSVVDHRDRIVPDADQRITFHLSGPGKILGVGNGNPADHDTDKADNRNTFHGRCIAIIQAGNQPGDIEVWATSEHFASHRLWLRGN